jgi:hypothetical protein
VLHVVIGNECMPACCDVSITVVEFEAQNHTDDSHPAARHTKAAWELRNFKTLVDEYVFSYPKLL